MLNNNRGRRWLVPVWLDKRSERFGVGKETMGGKKRFCQRERPATSAGLQHRVYALGLLINANSSKRSEEARDHLSLKLGDPAFKMSVHSICKATIRKGYTLVVAAPQERRVKLTQSSSRRIDWAGLRKDGQPRPRRAANEGRAEAGENLSPNERRHPNL